VVVDKIRTSLLAGIVMLAVAPAGTLGAAKVPAPPCAGTDFTCADAPVSGAPSASSAMVWVHLTGSTTVRLRYKPAGTKTYTKTPSQVTVASADNTQKFTLTGLAPSTTYAYGVGIIQADGSEAWSSDFFLRTAAPAPASLSFSVLADFANKLVKSPALANAAAAPNDFMVFMGDMDHRNPATDPDTKEFYPAGDPDVLASMRAMHQNMRNANFAIGSDFFKGLLKSSNTHPQVPFFYVWDDHDYCSNNVGADCLFRDFAFQAYRENYLWAPDSGLTEGNPCESVYQRVSYGPLLDLIMLDARSGRDMTAAVPTMLGQCQLDWLLDTLKNSTATWKILISPVPFNPTTKTYDAWGAFPAERARVLDHIATYGVRNVIVLSGDIHSGGAYDDGTESGLPEFSVPHANMPASWVDTYCQPIYVKGKLKSLNDEPGTWTIGTMTAPNTMPAPNCLGTSYPTVPATVSTPPPYPLEGAGAPGYARVELTPTTARVRILGADGTLRSGVRADGSPADLTMEFVAQ